MIVDSPSRIDLGIGQESDLVLTNPLKQRRRQLRSLDRSQLGGVVAVNAGLHLAAQPEAGEQVGPEVTTELESGHAVIRADLIQHLTGAKGCRRGIHCDVREVLVQLEVSDSHQVRALNVAIWADPTLAIVEVNRVKRRGVRDRVLAGTIGIDETQEGVRTEVAEHRKQLVELVVDSDRVRPAHQSHVADFQAAAGTHLNRRVHGQAAFVLEFQVGSRQNDQGVAKTARTVRSQIDVASHVIPLEVNGLGGDVIPTLEQTPPSRREAATSSARSGSCRSRGPGRSRSRSRRIAGNHGRLPSDPWADRPCHRP